MKLPGFDILDKLGEDRAATLWKAKQSSLNRIVTLRILRPNLAADPAERQAFLDEGRHIAKLKHPHIVAVYDVISEGDTYFYVTEYVEGMRLSERIKAQGRVPSAQALAIVRDVAEALRAAWQASHLVHCNVKPENIHIDGEGHAKLSFLGVTRMADPLLRTPDARHEPRLLVGTPYYMSPEQAQGLPNLDCRSDMYALGATLYHMLTGTMPFEACDPMTAAQQHISGFLHNPRDINAAIPVHVATFITHLLMKDRKNRYLNWDELLTDLARIMAGQPMRHVVPPKAVSTIEPEAKPIALTAAEAERQSAVPSRLRIPIVVQIPAWALILAWWYGLARFMLQFWAKT